LEFTASYIANDNANLEYFGNSLVTETNRKYVMAYTSADSGITNRDNAKTANYSANRVIGDAIKETSIAGTGKTSWYGDYSDFVGYDSPILLRGGGYWSGTIAGLFFYSGIEGMGFYNRSFRAVLVAK
jgi:hypothetical protein